MQRRVAVISMHPAPYRDPLFHRLKQEYGAGLDIITLFGDTTHTEWDRGPVQYQTLQVNASWLSSGRFAFHKDLPRVLREGDYGVVVVPGHAPLSALWADVSTLARHSRLVYSADTMMSPGRSRARPLARTLAHSASSLWVPGRASRAFWRMEAVPDDRIFEGSYTLSPSEIDEAISADAALIPSVSSGLGLNGKFVYLFVGKLIASRRVDDLIEAYSRVASEETSLLIIGDGPMSPAVDALIDKMSGCHVVRVPAVPFRDLHKFYALADAYVHPGSEPYSLAVQEAAFLGLPIIASNRVGAAWDFVKGSTVGVPFDFGSQESLQRSLLLAQRLEKNKGAAAAARKRGTTFAFRQFQDMLDVAEAGILHEPRWVH